MPNKRSYSNAIPFEDSKEHGLTELSLVEATLSTSRARDASSAIGVLTGPRRAVGGESVPSADAVVDMLKVLGAAGAGLAVLGKVVVPIRRMVAATRARLATDHRPIAAGWYSSHDQGGRSTLYVNVCCAPIGRHKPRHPFDRAAIEAWVDTNWPELVCAPTHADPQLLRFEPPNAGQGGSPDRAQMQCWACGLIELTMPVGYVELPDGQLALPLEAVIDPLWRLANLIREGCHERLFRRPFPRAHRLLDWTVSASSAINGSAGWQPVRAIAFRNEVLAGKPPDMRIDPSLSPAAIDRLRTISSRTAPRAIVRTFVDSLLHQSGYPSSVREAVIREVLKGIGARRATPATHTRATASSSSASV